MTRLTLALFAAFALGFAACSGDNGDDGAGSEAVEETPTMTIENGPPPASAEPTVTASGLQIIEIEVGSGATAEAGASVTVHYTGWLADGTKFDSSVDSGQPITFSLAGLIPGWQEGIPGMQVGGKRRLVIPPELGYGEAGSPPRVPPNAVLTFDIELLDVQ